MKRVACLLAAAVLVAVTFVWIGPSSSVTGQDRTEERLAALETQVADSKDEISSLKRRVKALEDVRSEQGNDSGGSESGGNAEPDSYGLMESVATELSTVGPDQVTDDVYRRGDTVSVRWDGTGRIVLSGCAADACDFSVDDAIRLYVEQIEPDEASIPAVDLKLRGSWSPALDVTNRFALGENLVRLDLVDLLGNSRGTNTPFYIVIL
jgi:hypothetical protein